MNRKIDKKIINNKIKNNNEINSFKWLLLFINLNFRIFIRYFTLWGFVIQGLYYLGFIKHLQESILYILILISLCGLVITYINPKHIIIPYYNIILEGKTLQILDILGHHLPLIIFLFHYNSKIKSDNLLFFMLIIIVYLLLINPFKTYNFNC